MEVQIEIPQNALQILETLEQAGFEAYVVGGCVRDSLIGRTPGDWDITTSAKPQEVKTLFRRTLDTGLQHGTVTVMFGKTGYEVTTYRLDGDYEDGRHPKSVEFTASLTEDLKRRDFTINAMAYNPKTGIVDLFGGQEDLENGIIRCVGCPEERFGEDALRILRAVRFSAQLGFEIEDRTERAILHLASTLNKISRERVQAELTKLLVSPHPDYFRKLCLYGITPQFFPEFDRMMVTDQDTSYHAYNVGEHTLLVLKNIEATPVLRWTALLHDCAKPETRTTDPITGQDHFKGHAAVGADRSQKILKNLKFDNETMRQVRLLIYYHDHRFPDGPDGSGKEGIRRCLRVIGPELFEDLLKVFRADNKAKNPLVVEKLLADVDRVERLFREILRDGDCFSLKQLAVKGSDLIAAGAVPGKELGEALERLLDAVLEDPALNQKEILLALWRQQEKDRKA